MRSSVAALGLALLVAAPSLGDEPKKADPPKPEAKPAVERRATLENGLEVIVLPSSRAKWVVLVTAFRAGSRDESASETGAANLVSRIVRHAACGSRKAQEAEQELAALGPGMKETEPGAEARRDVTCFFATVSEEKLGAALDIERDRLERLAPTAELADAERGRAIAEVVVDAEKPSARAFGTLLSLAYGESGIGRSRQSLATKVQSLDLAALETWRRAHLRVENAFVVVAGARDPDAAIELVKAKLGSLPRSKDAPPAPPALPALAKGPVKATVDGPAAFRQVLVGWRGPDPGTADEAAFLVLSLHVNAKVGPAIKPFVHEADTSAELDARSDSPALLFITASPRTSVTTAELEGKIEAAVSQARTEAPDLAKLKERVARSLANLTAPLDPKLQTAKDEAQALAHAAIARAVAEPLVKRREALEKHLDALTKESFLEAAGRILSDERSRVVVAEPSRASEKPPEEPKPQDPK